MRQTTPSIPFSKFVILLWNCSGAEAIPKGSLLNRYLPAGVINIVSRDDSLARGICQKPELASNFEKYRAPDTCARVCSTVSSSRMTFVFSFVRSTHNYSYFSLRLGHHNHTGTPLRRFLNSRDTLLGVLKAKGLAPSLS